MKEYPSIETFTELVGEYLQDGFITASDLLILSEVILAMKDPCDAVVSDVNEPILPFSIGYVKGMTRSCSMLSLLYFLFCANVNIFSRLPVLYVSTLKVFGHAKPHGNKVDEAFENMKLSLRGDIRRAVNLIQLAMMGVFTKNETQSNHR